ncbi:MAG TPA: hypothetical protein VGB98_12250 [Pyrinomonadaceae bacterium]
MSDEQGRSFAEWMEQLRREAVELLKFTPGAAAGLAAEGFKVYFAVDMTPTEALYADFCLALTGIEEVPDEPLD